MAFASVLVWVNALNLLRPFQFTGPFVQMIYAVTIKILPFFLILMIVIFGFSQAFYLLANDNNDHFGTIQDAYLYDYVIYSYVTGGVDYSSTSGDEVSNMLIFLQTIYIAFTQIMLLNLIIAFLGHIHSTIQRNAEAVGLYERCKIIMCQVRPWGVQMGKRYIHFLKRKSDVKADELLRDCKESTDKLLVNELNRIQKENDKAGRKFREGYDRLKNDNDKLRADIKSINDKLDKLLER